MDTDHGVNIFEGKHMTALMIYLFNRGGSATKMEVYHDVASNDRMPGKFSMLEDAGLITQTQNGVSRAVILSLTPKGREVAEEVCFLDSIMRGSHADQDTRTPN